MEIQTNLFDFAFMGDWLAHLGDLAAMALPEPWHFVNPSYITANTETPILDRYIKYIFRKQAIEYTTAQDSLSADKAFYIRNEYACFHTGLYTPRYNGIYMYFERNPRKDSLLDWKFRAWAEHSSPLLRYIDPLPERPSFYSDHYGSDFIPDWKIRVNINHILGDQENIERLPKSIRDYWNLPLMLETAVEFGRRQAVIAPSLVVPHVFQGHVQFLMPIHLVHMEQPDFAMVLAPMDGYYYGHTCLLLEMAYMNARILSRPTAKWLTKLVERTGN